MIYQVVQNKSFQALFVQTSIQPPVVFPSPLSQFYHLTPYPVRLQKKANLLSIVCYNTKVAIYHNLDHQVLISNNCYICLCITKSMSKNLLGCGLCQWSLMLLLSLTELGSKLEESETDRFDQLGEHQLPICQTQLLVPQQTNYWGVIPLCVGGELTVSREAARVTTAHNLWQDFRYLSPGWKGQRHGKSSVLDVLSQRTDFSIAPTIGWVGSHNGQSFLLTKHLAVLQSVSPQDLWYGQIFCHSLSLSHHPVFLLIAKLLLVEVGTA